MLSGPASTPWKRFYAAIGFAGSISLQHWNQVLYTLSLLLTAFDTIVYLSISAST